MKNTIIARQQKQLKNILARLRRLNMTIHSFSNLPNTSRRLCSRQIHDIKDILAEMDVVLEEHKTPIDPQQFSDIHEGLVTLQKIQNMQDGDVMHGKHKNNGHSPAKMSLSDVA